MMQLSLSWRPSLEDTPRPVGERLLNALERDVRGGALQPGTRLPPQRDLAFSLGIALGTVTKAYAEAERRGLLQATVGRGTFVATPAPDAAFRLAAGRPQALNLSLNVRPVLSSQSALSETLGKLRKRGDLLDVLTYCPPAGVDAHRQAAAAWLARTTPLALDWRSLLVTAGAQQALALALGAVAKPGDTVLTESGTYYGVRTLAEHAGYRLRGVGMDAEGLDPDALDRAAATSGARVLYTVPTLQNPTGRSLSEARRAEIVRIARARDLWIVEDDVYALYGRAEGQAALSPLALLAPERTLYVSSASKSLAAGLRVGFLAMPGAEVQERVLHAVRSQTYSPPSLGPMIVSQWIEDGVADTLAAEVLVEMARRTQAALAILGPAAAAPASPHSLHLWLPMPELEAERVVSRALRAGVELMPPAAPIVDGHDLSGVRVCLGGIEAFEDLEQGLQAVALALRGERDCSARCIV